MVAGRAAKSAREKQHVSALISVGQDMECNSVCLGIKQYFGNLLSEVAFWVAIVISAIIAMRIAISLYRDIRSKVREKQLMRIKSEIEELVRAIIKEYPSPRLT